MGLKKVTLQEMAQISLPWTTQGDEARAIIERVPLLKALLPQIEAAHASIFALRQGGENSKAVLLSQEAAQVDAQHDTLVRGIHGTLTMLAHLTDDSDELLQLRDLLLPEGLAHTRKTYRGEAGHAALVATRLDKGIRARLKKVALHERDLLEVVTEWLSVGKKLGELEEERARLEPAPGTPAAIVNAARFSWIRVANALVANAALAEVSSDEDRILFSALRAAERRADERMRSRPDDESESTDPPDPQPPEATPDPEL